MKHIIGLLAIVVLAGCSTQGGAGYTGMTEGQLTALAKMKDANVQCSKGSTALLGSFFTVFVNLDRGVIPEGGITVSPDCQVTLTNTRVVTTVTTTTSPIPPVVPPK